MGNVQFIALQKMPALFMALRIEYAKSKGNVVAKNAGYYSRAAFSSSAFYDRRSASWCTICRAVIY